MPPQYGRLGGEPEPEIEPGSWDPWAHPLPGRFSHDGFFLRLNLGVGFAGVSRPNEKWSAAALGMGVSLGGSLVENLALHIDFRSTLMPSPTHTVQGRDSDYNGDIALESVGIGLTYYIMPSNVFVSGSVGLARLVFEDEDGRSKDTSAGLSLAGMVGKEWWVGSDWGLGIAGQVLFARVRDYIDDKHLNALAFNLVFSATYN
jgi:hypothetical protein